MVYFSIIIFVAVKWLLTRLHDLFACIMCCSPTRNRKSRVNYHKHLHGGLTDKVKKLFLASLSATTTTMSPSPV